MSSLTFIIVVSQSYNKKCLRLKQYGSRTRSKILKTSTSTSLLRDLRFLQRENWTMRTVRCKWTSYSSGAKQKASLAMSSELYDWQVARRCSCYHNCGPSINELAGLKMALLSFRCHHSRHTVSVPYCFRGNGCGVPQGGRIASHCFLHFNMAWICHK